MDKLSNNSSVEINFEINFTICPRIVTSINISSAQKTSSIYSMSSTSDLSGSLFLVTTPKIAFQALHETTQAAFVNPFWHIPLDAVYHKDFLFILSQNPYYRFIIFIQFRLIHSAISLSITIPQSVTPRFNQNVLEASKSFAVMGFVRCFLNTHSLTIRFPFSFTQTKSEV